VVSFQEGAANYFLLAAAAIAITKVQLFLGFQKDQQEASLV